MRSIITVIAIISFIIACTPRLANQPAPVTNREATDKKGNLILLGKCTRERLTKPPFDSWFNKNYAAYSVDSNTANQLKPLLKHKQFLLFMGTWCGDSRREVPRIYKILDYCHIKPSQLQLITLNNSDTAYKQSPGHEEKGLNIKRVPTLLVFENHREQERIVESPVVSLEKDLLAIVTAQPYEHHYKSPSTAPPATTTDSTRLQRPTGNN
jgi:thiol-disulfide isomerase/thioredoxin